MIDFTKILKRAWRVLWDYRILWVFGILLAVTAGGGGNFNFNANDINLPEKGWDLESLPPALRQLAEWFQQDVLPLLTHPEEHVTTILWIVVAVLSFALVVSIIRAILSYVSQTAIMRMVDEYEQSGVKVGFRAGWRLGWNRRAFRLWLIDLIIYAPIMIVFFASFFGVAILLIATSSGAGANVGLIAALSIGSILLLVFLFIAVMAALSLLREFFARAAVLEGLGVFDSLRHGWQMFRTHWKSAAWLWLIMAGVGIAVAIVSILAFFLLIPVYLLLLLPAVLVAAIPGAIAFGIASLFTTGPLSWIIGVVFALPFFFTILFAPLFVLEGWYQVYAFNVWTLAYREMKALGSVPPKTAPATLSE